MVDVMRHRPERVSISMMCHDSSEASLVIWTPWMILSRWTLSSWYYGSLLLTKLSNWRADCDPQNRPKVKSASYWHVELLIPRTGGKFNQRAILFANNMPSGQLFFGLSKRKLGIPWAVRVRLD
jgi:hypothetical protein